jgi:hypothetical protein
MSDHFSLLVMCNHHKPKASELARVYEAHLLRNLTQEDLRGSAAAQHLVRDNLDCVTSARVAEARPTIKSLISILAPDAARSASR